MASDRRSYCACGADDVHFEPVVQSTGLPWYRVYCGACDLSVVYDTPSEAEARKKWDAMVVRVVVKDIDPYPGDYGC